LNIVEIREHHAELTIKGANTPIEKIDIEISYYQIGHPFGFWVKF
jgi:hypothetical protein